MKYDLTEFDNRLADGLTFCKKVYALFAHIRRAPDGIARLRLRQGETEKKLIEELIPIARYIQARYSHGRRLKIRWINGNQQYDAYLLSAGPLVENGVVPRKVFVEVTTAVHEHEHIVRRMINDKGYAFGAKGIQLDKRTRIPVSKPHVYKNDEAQGDLAARLIGRIRKKTTIAYPRGTALVIQCFLDTLFLQDEWDDAISRLKDADVKHGFSEVFIFDSNHAYSATINRYGTKGE